MSILSHCHAFPEEPISKLPAALKDFRPSILVIMYDSDSKSPPNEIVYEKMQFSAITSDVQETVSAVLMQYALEM